MLNQAMLKPPSILLAAALALLTACRTRDGQVPARPVSALARAASALPPPVDVSVQLPQGDVGERTPTEPDFGFLAGAMDGELAFFNVERRANPAEDDEFTSPGQDSRLSAKGLGLCTKFARALPRASRRKVSCAESPDQSVWAVVVTTTLLEGVYEVGTGYTVHVDREGHATQFAPFPYERPTYNGARPQEKAEPTGVVFLDFDKDGHFEATMIRRLMIDAAGGESVQLELLSAPKAQVVPAATKAASTAFWIADVDRDRVPDFLVNPYQAIDRFPVEGGMHHARGWRAWSLLAHVGSDGSVSMSDSVALRYAKSICPSAPTSYFQGDIGEWPHEVHCALLWGVPLADMVNKLEHQCGVLRAGDNRPYELDEYCPVAPKQGIVQKMAKALLPLTLRTKR